MEGNLRFKIDWASHIVGSKFTVFALFYFVFEGNFPSTSPQRAYIWRGDLPEGFFPLPLCGAYIWRDLYMEGLIFGILRFLLLRTVIFQKAVIGCPRPKGDKTQFQLAGLELSESINC